MRFTIFSLFFILFMNAKAAVFLTKEISIPKLLIVYASQTFQDASETREGGILTSSIVYSLSNQNRYLTWDDLLPSIVKKTIGLSGGEQLASIVTTTPDFGDRICGKSKTYIVSIGINTYIDRQIPTLRYASIDAKNIYNVFENVCDAHGLVLIDQKAVSVGIINIIKSILQTARKEDNIIISFSGHGVKVYGEEMLLTHDSKYSNGSISEINSTAISVDNLKRMIIQSGNNVVLILDTSFNHLTRKWH